MLSPPLCVPCGIGDFTSSSADVNLIESLNQRFLRLVSRSAGVREATSVQVTARGAGLVKGPECLVFRLDPEYHHVYIFRHGSKLHVPHAKSLVFNPLNGRFLGLKFKILEVILGFYNSRDLSNLWLWSDYKCPEVWCLTVHCPSAHHHYQRIDLETRSFWSLK
ncbi:hypothetical protein RRG08_056669 [Elysia crispata]|uniref:Uncharacterized protein n=1 Tax=Elysia crispata TaxID=231223 RepID=A0AAE0YG78_9GAST|nr:hypothetical protein RRG08_056669 [Elysia crispata]